MKTETETHTKPPNYVHDELAHNLQLLTKLRREILSNNAEYQRKIANLEQLIETQAFDVFPDLEESACFWDGDPVSFLAGPHQVRLYRIKGKTEVEINRSHVLETTVDLFAEDAES